MKDQMAKIAAVGDNVVDCYVINATMYPGGNTLNVSVYVRRFGGESAYVGAIAKDAAGRQIEAALRTEGVDLSRLRVLDGSTAYCIIGHTGAERAFLRSDLGVSMFTPSAEDLDFIAGFDAAHIGRSSGLDSHLDAVAARTRLSYDFSTSRDPAHFARVAPLCFLASASAGDLDSKGAQALLGQLLLAGARWALVTCGKEGAMLSDGQRIHVVPAAPTALIDTLGAGDAFTARTLLGLIHSEQPADLLDAAARAAADACRYYGAIGYGAPIELVDPVIELALPTANATPRASSAKEI